MTSTSGPLRHIERTLQAYSDAYSAILGAPRGSLRMDGEMLRFWLDDVS